MAKERALTLEALRVMDAIDRRGSFAAAADELGRVPSALSYTMQKLEEELDVVLFDRSGHRTKFTNVGRMLLERGRVLLEAADKLTTDAEALSRGWETHLTIVTEALVPTTDLFPLIEKLATKSNTQLSIITEVLAGAWERLEQGRADIVVAPDMHFRSSSEINSRKLYSVMSVYVAARRCWQGWASPRCPIRWLSGILPKGACGWSARSTATRSTLLWPGAGTAWVRQNHGVCGKSRSYL